MIAAVDAGGTNLKAALIAGDGRPMEKSILHMPSDSNGTKEKIVSRLSECLAAMLEIAAGASVPVRGMAFAYPGPFDYAKGRCLMKHKYASVYGIPILPEVARVVSLPDVPVLFCHDIHAFAYGEYSGGRGRDARSLFCVSIGTGVGTGWIKEGHIVAGPDCGPRWSIYMLPYKDGVLEDWVSARGIVRRYRELSGTAESPEPREVAARAESQDPAALSAFRELGTALGLTLRPILAETETDVLILGGQISRAFNLFRPSLEKELTGLPALVTITTAADPDLSALRGAAALLRQNATG